MPVILADLGGLFAVGFLLISFIGWIINLINAQNPPPAPNRGPQRRPQARDRKVQDEIEQFLQEAMGGDQRRRRETVADDEIEVVEEGPARRPPQQRRSPTTPRRKPPAPPIVPPAAVRPGGGISSRQMPPPRDFGGSVGSHLQDHMRERMNEGVAQHLPHAVDQGVTQHLGEFTGDDHDPRASVKPFYRSRANVSDSTGLIADLRKRDGIRKAILLQEILARPRALRK